MDKANMDSEFFVDTCPFDAEFRIDWDRVAGPFTTDVEAKEYVRNQPKDKHYRITEVLTPK